MRIDHIAIYTKKLDRLKSFYEYYFGGISNTKYKNKTTKEVKKEEIEKKEQIEGKEEIPKLSDERQKEYRKYIQNR